MRVALTYDDGPSDWTPPILDLLKHHDAHATFFVCGAHIPTREPLLRRTLEEGHAVGNHTMTHPHLPTLHESDIELELWGTSRLIFLATGSDPTLYRAPHHDRDEKVDRIAGKCGLRYVNRSIDPADWMLTDSERIAKVVLDNLHDGGIVNLHDGIPPLGGTGAPGRQHVVEATRLILGGAPTTVEFVTADHL